jgi:hypothetical protein
MDRKLQHACAISGQDDAVRLKFGQGAATRSGSEIVDFGALLRCGWSWCAVFLVGGVDSAAAMYARRRRLIIYQADATCTVAGHLAMWGLAGAPGFEPGNAGTKNRCLTAWRRPNWRGSYTVWKCRATRPLTPQKAAARRLNGMASAAITRPIATGSDRMKMRRRHQIPCRLPDGV